MNFGNFGNTNCYRYLTSQVLAASRCGNYYGPDLFTNKNQPTFNKYQAQQERLRVKQQQAEQDYLCPSNYNAFINSINSNIMPDAANQAIRLNQQMGLQQLGRNNVPCRTDCNEITDSLWSAAKKSSIYVPDTATTWYECQREQNMGGNLSDKCKMFGISSRESYQPHQHLQLARPIRDGEQRRMDPKSFKHISPEFLSLLEEHEQAMLARNPLYGVDTKGERAPFCDVPRERLQKRQKSYSTTTATTDKRTSRPQRQSRTKSRSRQDERRGLIQTISDTCFSDSPKTTKNRNSSLRQSKYNERMAGGEDGEFSKKKNFNETSRIKIRSNIKADVCNGGIFQPKENYELAAALSSGYRRKSGVSLCGNMLKAEYRRATAELTKKVHRKENVIGKRKSREERAARTHKKCENKENNEQSSEIRDNNRLMHYSIQKDLFGQMTVDKQQHESKPTKEANKLELIWHKKDITRMRDSEISLQVTNMRRYAETESRSIVHGKTKLGCEELERLKDIDRQRELTKITYFRAEAGRDISQNDVVDKQVTIDFSSEVDDLAQISTEMKKLKKNERSLKTSLYVGNKFSHETANEIYQQKLSHTEAELDNCQAEEQAPVVVHGKKLKSRKYKKEGFVASIEPRDSLEHAGLIKKRRNTLQSFHAQRKKLVRVRENQSDAIEKETKQRNYSKQLHTSLSKLCDENRVCEKRSVHSYSSARSIQPCTNLSIKSKTKAKLNARVKVPKSACKHYRNKNMPPRRRKAGRKYHTTSSLCHSELYELSAQNSLELLRQRQKSNKRLLVQTATNSCVKFNASLNSRALSKSEFSSCTTVNKNSLNHMADDVPSTSKAAVKSCAVVQDFKSMYSTSDNETRCEPSTSSLEEMLVHIKTQLKQRHNKKHGSSDKSTNSCTQKIRLQQQNAKDAGKSSKAKGQSASRKQINKPRKRHKRRPLVDSIRIPLVRNNAFILGQQNRSIEIAYAIGSHSLNIKSMEDLMPPATQPNSRRGRKLRKKSSNGVQESEA